MWDDQRRDEKNSFTVLEESRRRNGPVGRSLEVIDDDVSSKQSYIRWRVRDMFNNIFTLKLINLHFMHGISSLYPVLPNLSRNPEDIAESCRNLTGF
jgi:hypothetical protein